MVDRSDQPVPGRPRRSMAAHAQKIIDPPAGFDTILIASELEKSLRASDLPIAVGARAQAIVGGRRFTMVPTEMERNGIRGRLDHYLRYEARPAARPLAVLSARGVRTAGRDRGDPAVRIERGTVKPAVIALWVVAAVLFFLPASAWSGPGRLLFPGS